ncbi:hypothetical protein BH11MYX1_BH11MYX1_11180 [soil metagenome]
MRILVVAPALLLAAGCLTDPPYRPYSAQSSQQSGSGPLLPPAPKADPLKPTTDPNLAPPSSGGSYQTNLSGQPSGPQPPPYIASSPGQTGGQAGVPGASPPPPIAPPPQATPPSALPTTVAGRYQCWVNGAGMYAPSSLGLVTLDFNNSYSSTQSQATGTYKVDGSHVLLTGGPLAGYVGSLETNQNGRLVRFRVEMPSDPGPALRIGDHVCYLAH